MAFTVPRKLAVVAATALALAVPVPALGHALPLPAASHALDAATIESASRLIRSYARNGEESAELFTLGSELAPVVADFTSEEVQVARAHAASALIDAIENEPERAEELIEWFCGNYGEPAQNPSVAVQAATMETLVDHCLFILLPGGEVEETARDLVLEQLLPPITDYDAEDVQIARVGLIDALFDSAVASLDADGADGSRSLIDQIKLINSYYGEPAQDPSARLQGVVASHYGPIVRAAARYGEHARKWLDMIELFIPRITDFDADEVQAGRVDAVIVLAGSLRAGTGIDEAEVEQIATFTESILGKAVEEPGEQTRAALAKTLQFRLVEEMGLSEGQDGLLLQRLLPSVDALDAETLRVARAETLAGAYSLVGLTGCDVQAVEAAFTKIYGELGEEAPSRAEQFAALESLESLFDDMARSPESYDDLLAVAKRLSPAIDLGDSGVRCAAVEAVGSVFIASARQPEMMDKLVAAAKELGLTDFDEDTTDLPFQIGRAGALGDLLEACGRNPEMLDTLKALFLKWSGEVPTFTVSFDAAGGSAVESVSVRLNERMDEPAAPVREGYTFTGWTFNGDTYDFSQPVLCDAELTATWKAAESPKPGEDPADPKDPANPADPSDKGDDASRGDGTLPQTGDTSAFAASVVAVGGLAVAAAGGVALKRRRG